MGCSPWGRYESDTNEHLQFHFSHIGEGNGNPLQYSCLENPRDGGAWWPAVYGVTQSRTRLKQLSSSSRTPSQLCHLPPLLSTSQSGHIQGLPSPGLVSNLRPWAARFAESSPASGGHGNWLLPQGSRGALLPFTEVLPDTGSPPKTGPSDRTTVPLKGKLGHLDWHCFPLPLERSCISDVQSCLGVEFGRKLGSIV